MTTPETTRQEYPKAGVGCGGIFFRQTGPRSVRVLLASRAENVGKGSGISFGGWMNLASLYKKNDGDYITAQSAAAREGVQEIPGLLTVIPKEEFLLNMQFLFSAGVYKPKDPYGNTFHNATFFGIAISEAEEIALCKLPKSRETSAPLRPFDLSWTKPDGSDMAGLPSDFHHPHEVDAFRALCWRLDYGLLHTARVAPRLAA